MCGIVPAIHKHVTDVRGSIDTLKFICTIMSYNNTCDVM